ncbi:molecular chaperone DnaK [Chloroflexota bacterium]
MGKVVGIDLGTTFSLVATMENGEPVIIPIAEGGSVVPSIVAMTNTKERLIGGLARRQAVFNVENTIYSIKRLMGCKYSDPSVQKAMKRLPYKIREAHNGDAWVTISGKECSPQEISAMILYKLKLDAEAYLGEEITDAIITVPAYFNDAQRQATKDAGAIAGLNVLHIISEPTAAALAYGMHKHKGEQMTVAVYDLGGGTFDISILEINTRTFRVRSTSGDVHLGGDDFDDRIVDWICSEFQRENGIDLGQDKMALQRIRDASQSAKHELSAIEQTEINLPYITSDETGPKHLVISFRRDQLESLISDLIKKTVDYCRRALDDAGLSISEIDEVLIVGGSSRIPRVQEEVERFFSQEPRKGIDPDEAIVIGAAIHASMLIGDVEDVSFLDVTPLTLGIRTVGDVATPIIPRNTPIPTCKTRTFSTASDFQRSMDIQVYQGESRIFDDNKMLGCFTIVNLPPASAGVVKVDVTFNIDADGILNVHAQNNGTGDENEITISITSGLKEEEIEQISQEFKIRNNAEALVCQVKKTLPDLEGRVTDELKEELEDKVDSVKAALKGQDVPLISNAMKDLCETLETVKIKTNQEEATTSS